MSAHNPIAADVDGSERLSADDQATQREQQFLAAALAAQQEVSQAVISRRGTCSACGAQCLPLAVYCDDECRAEHEQRQLILRRQGRTR